MSSIIHAQQQQNLGGTNTIVTAKNQLLVDSAYRGPLDTLHSAPLWSEAYKNGVKYVKQGDGHWHAFTSGGGTDSITANAAATKYGVDTAKQALRTSIAGTQPALSGTGYPKFAGTTTPTYITQIPLGTDVTGNLGISHLGSGTGATGTTFFAGDGTWKTPSTSLPDQTNKMLQFLSTNGTTPNWSYPLSWKAFGGVGDSSTDNTSNLQTFIDLQDSTPCVIYIGPGRFKFSSGVHTHVYSRITFIGAGGDGLNHVSGTHVWNSSITRLIKNFTGYLITDSAVRASNFFDIGLEDVHENTTSGGGIKTLGLSPKYINCAFTNFYVCVEQSNANYPLFENCHFINPVQYGIFNYGSVNPDQGDMTINNCNFDGQGNTTVAMIYQNSSGGTKVSNCKWNGLGTVDCIYMNITGSTSDLTCTNNSFENFTGYGIHVDVASGIDFSNINIVGGNISSYHAGTGIYFDASLNPGHIHRISVAGVSMNNLNRAIIASYVDNMALGTNNYDTTTVSVVFAFAGCTHIYSDRQVATQSQSGQMGYLDRQYLDLLQSSGGIEQFKHSTSTSDTSIYFSFYGFDNDIADLTPEINTPAGSFVQIFSSGNTTIQTSGGQGFLHTEGGTTGYLIPTGVSAFDVSTKFLVPAFGTGNWALTARGSDASNYLQVQITAGNMYIVQNVAGAQTGLFTLGSNPLVANDIVHLQVSGSNWKLFINADSISSGTFDASLTTQKAGIEVNSGTQDTRFTNFTVTSIPDVSGGWSVLHDGTLAGNGVDVPLTTGATRGSSTQSGNGTTTSFTIAHGLSGVSSTSNVSLTPRSAAAAGSYYVTTDATNITIIYIVAPTIGTNNLTWSYSIKP